MKVTNKFNVGNEVFYISNGQLHKGVIESVSITQRINSEKVTYTFNSDFTSYEESHVFAAIDDATRYFLTEVKKN